MDREELVSPNSACDLITALAVRYAQFWNRVWPFEHGRGFPAVRLMSLATACGAMQPAWLEFKPGLWMRLDVRDLLQRKILLSGEFDPGCTRFILDSLGPGMVFLDVGAHAGYYALLAAQRVGNQGRVLCVEPNPAMAAQIQANVQRNGLSNVTIVEAACSATCGRKMLYIPDFPLSVKSSLAPESAGTSRGVEVDCVTGDHLCGEYGLSRIDVLKIDVEGAEMQVLAGMAGTLARFRPRIVIELRAGLLKNFSATVEGALGLLDGFGYRVVASDGDGDHYLVHQGEQLPGVVN
jgi:FkbM family methyltransferase